MSTVATSVQENRIQKPVLLVDATTQNAFHRFTPQEARQAINYIKRLRSGEDDLTSEQRNDRCVYRQFMLQLHEKGNISTRSLVTAFDLDPDEEERMIKEEQQKKQVDIQTMENHLLNAIFDSLLKTSQKLQTQQPTSAANKQELVRKCEICDLLVEVFGEVVTKKD